MGLGIKRKGRNMGQSVRFFCLECMGGYDEYKDQKGKPVAGYLPVSLVRDCPAHDCHLYPYRFGKGARAGKEVSAETLSVLQANREKLAETRRRSPTS